MNDSNQQRPHVVVSLTSIPSRYWTLPLVLRSLVRQRYDNITVELYLADGTVPRAVRRMEKRNPRLRVHQVEDRGPATKFLYVIPRHPDVRIAICDDDHYYHPRWLETLVRWSLQLTGTCIAMSGAVEISSLDDEAPREKLVGMHGGAPGGKEIYRKLVGTAGFDRPVPALWPQGYSGYLLPPGLGERLDVLSHFEDCRKAIPATVASEMKKRLPDDVVMGAYLYRLGVGCVVAPRDFRHLPLLSRFLGSSFTKSSRRYSSRHGVGPSFLTYLALAEQGWFPPVPVDEQPRP